MTDCDITQTPLSISGTCWALEDSEDVCSNTSPSGCSFCEVRGADRLIVRRLGCYQLVLQRCECCKLILADEVWVDVEAPFLLNLSDSCRVT